MTGYLNRQDYRPETIPFGAAAALFTAMSIARVWKDKPPTVEGLRDKYGMSRATAYRWIAAWKAANGIA